MIFFRDQRINHADHESFSLRFGDFADDAYTKGVEGHVNVQPVIKEAGTEVAMIFGSGWHTDSAFLPKPPAISMLYGVDIPPYGGDTIWANAALAYATLSETMQAMIAPLRVHMSMRTVLVVGAGAAWSPTTPPSAGWPPPETPGRSTRPSRRKVQGHRPPARAHAPGDGRAGAVLRQDLRPGIDGMTEAESEPLLRFLSDHITQPAFTCRLRWEPGTFAVWDNRLCVHQAFNDYDGYRRELYRTTVAGEVPA